ncbi:odorant receptor 85b-like [Diorhabda sublineata]|uniref:odorant receptor 85b-like n=1 Tax=Diorhabda sublineata TaxID=1163346 RepID=UPI0024E1447E|nr:odorant receptor 85b-like [Diorhabda sublineata]
MVATHVKIVNLIEAFDVEKRHLTYGGFYPIRNYSTLNKCLYYIKATFTTTISCLEWLLLIIFVYTKFPDILKVSECLLICLSQTAFIFKLINFIKQKNGMLIIEEQLRDSLLTDIDEEEEKIFVEYVTGVKQLAKVYRSICAVAVGFFGLCPILDQGSEEIRKLPIPIWVPFNTEDYYFYIWLAILFSLCISVWTNCTIDILTIMLFIIATAQFKILIKRFKNVVPPGDKNIHEAIVSQSLTKCIVQFNKINSFINTLENIFSNGIFIQFLCSVLVICLTGFQMFVISFQKLEIILLFTYFNCMMCQVVMYCWYGHLLMESSDEITEACYSTFWYKCNAKIQKIFITVMERSKYPVKLKAGNFYTLNLATLMTILRSSYSYFAVIQHVYTNRMQANMDSIN